MRKLTENAAAIGFNGSTGRREHEIHDARQDKPMLTAIIVTIVLVATLAYALRSGRTGGLIVRRPYNNRHSDAAAARDDHLG